MLYYPLWFLLPQGLEKAFKAHKYNRDYSEDHSHELSHLIPNIVGLRDMASPLVVCIQSSEPKSLQFNLDLTL